MIASLHTRSAQLVSTLRTLEKSPRAAGDLERIFSDESLCLSNMEEAILAIQEGTRLVEDAEGELRTLISRVERLETVRDEVEAVREVASILRALEPLLAKISPADPPTTSQLCSSSPDATLSYLRSLAAALQHLAADPKLRLSSEQENEIARSGYILVALTSFLADLRNQARLFNNLCLSDQENTGGNIGALANIIGSLADLAESLGEDSAAQQIRRGERLAQNIVVSSEQSESPEWSTQLTKCPHSRLYTCLELCIYGL